MVKPRNIRSGRRPRSRSASVRSILALAGAAAAIPLSGSPADAAVISDSSLSGTVIGWNSGQTRSVFRALPGLGGGGFTIGTRATNSGGLSGGGYFGVVMAGPIQIRRKLGGLNAAYLAPFGATVNRGQNPGTFANVNLGNAHGVNKGNAAFSGPPSKYLLFRFSNAGTTNYGWIELTAATVGFTGAGTAGDPYRSGYSATLGKWAYDNSGVAITAGFEGSPSAVPEPGSATIAMAGALVAGARGLRRWRKQRAQVAPASGQA